jgi:hypothetical protein
MLLEVEAQPAAFGYDSEDVRVEEEVVWRRAAKPADQPADQPSVGVSSDDVIA